EAARVYKVTALSLVAELGEHVAAAAGLSPREGAELVGAACALAGMLYQASNPPPALAQVYAEDPALDAACPKMAPSLARALTALAAGLPALREQQPG